MVYSAISSRRMPYDIDGTEIGYRAGSGDGLAVSIGRGISAWMDSTRKLNLNAESSEVKYSAWNGSSAVFWFFFPERREIEMLGFMHYITAAGDISPSEFLVQGSNDTVNGLDGTWESAVITPAMVVNSRVDWWREKHFAISLSTSYKVLRIGVRASSQEISPTCIHIYGRKAAGETPDDILFVDASTGAEKTALTDWGDRPEGTTEIDSFKVKNASSSKIANDINLQLNHADFLMAWSPDGPWAATLDIATLGIGALSNTVYIRNALGPPLLTLGPKAARVIASVGSWS